MRNVSRYCVLSLKCLGLFLGTIVVCGILLTSFSSKLTAQGTGTKITGESEIEKSSETSGEPVYALVIHGGAGVLNTQVDTPEKEKQYRLVLEEALKAGYSILEKGGKSLDAVEAAIRILEDCPLFNAGKGAVFAANGANELDASIMDGKSLKAGSVAGVTHIKNPIGLARMVMESSPHVMMVGQGAESFAKTMGVKLVSNKYFFTKERWDQLQKAKREERQKEIDQKNIEKKKLGTDANENYPSIDRKFGTVGAVALDKEGNLAAGTSTGGMTNKKFSRVGDSPIIGAGTYANNRTCAVSSTGYGEYFIRSVVAYDISAMMEYGGMTLQQAADISMKKVSDLGGNGGVIGIDRKGNISMSFSTPGMFRGFIGKDGQPHVRIFPNVQENLNSGKASK